jgi:hypothetical protein
MNPDGEVNGVLLDDNTIVRFPPHLSDQLIGTVNPHDPMKVQGFAESQNTIQAWTITNLRNQRSVTDTPPGPARIPSVPSENRQPMSASGRIRAVTHAPQGEPDGAILIDGTNVHLPLASGREYSNLFQPGQTLRHNQLIRKKLGSDRDWFFYGPVTEHHGNSRSARTPRPALSLVVCF